MVSKVNENCEENVSAEEWFNTIKTGDREK
jgi:hypothetical protein